MKEFRGMMLEAGQEAVDKAAEVYADALGTVENYDDAAGALLAAFAKRSGADMAGLIDEIRCAAGGIGGSHE
jgi:hypothetical protein